MPLLVPGPCADYRLLRKTVRKAGLAVVYVDRKEVQVDRGTQPYPLVTLQEADYIINKIAARTQRQDNS